MEGRIGSKAHGPDQEPSGRGATTRSQVERLRTGLPQQSNRLGGLYADDQVLSMYADGHIATEEERDPAEHLLLDDPRSTRELFPNPCGLHFRERQRPRQGATGNEPCREPLTKAFDAVSSQSRASSGRTRRSSTGGS